MLNFSRNLAVSLAILLASAASALAAGENLNMREISAGVYSFTLGQGNYSILDDCDRV